MRRTVPLLSNGHVSYERVRISQICISYRNTGSSDRYCFLSLLWSETLAHTFQIMIMQDIEIFTWSWGEMFFVAEGSINLLSVTD